ncbi:flagellar protein FlaG [Methylomarinovum caldicuralii]|uniref:Flagellar protein FlaG n=1 Tax=Methylomarinovum caldicuralii TaxID=438856 RepID=A0AAU9BRH8_9GAMM|nr:flagellar protein FlaG [Methylomarinovum caldicuralii]BCX81408.1 flagellar protein FlaG [Methylomarinovum caldicuralii]
MNVETLMNPYPPTSPAAKPATGHTGTNPATSKPAGERQAEAAPEPEQLEEAVKQINDYLQTVQRNLEFSIDRDTHKVVVKVLDAESGEVVRQIPPKSALELAKAMKESKEEGLLFAQRV